MQVKVKTRYFMLRRFLILIFQFECLSTHFSNAQFIAIRDTKHFEFDHCISKKKLRAHTLKILSKLSPAPLSGCTVAGYSLWPQCDAARRLISL